eukprot:GILI01037022.1.p1 GENE.GILI01037022.1~~GILI01037022.1.p1  ORF type:complete len:163 (+),score=31.71 GILI01037022.1:73-561(+)
METPNSRETEEKKENKEVDAKEVKAPNKVENAPTEGAGEAVAAAAEEPQQERIIEKLLPYFGPLLIYFVIQMFQWSEDTPAAPAATSAESVSTGISAPAAATSDASVFAQVFSFAPDPTPEEGFLSKTGFFGDCLVIIAAGIAIALWRASTRVERGPTGEAK